MDGRHDIEHREDVALSEGIEVFADGVNGHFSQTHHQTIEILVVESPHTNRSVGMTGELEYSKIER